MNIRFYNARILKTNDDQSFEIVDGELWVKGNTIAYIDSGDNIGSAPGLGDEYVTARSIDCNGNLLMPGFKNAHTHTAMTFLRSFADDLPLQDWLFNAVFPREDKLTEDDIYWLDILGIMEYLTSGITSNFDMYFFPPMNAKASVDCGFRTVQTSGMNNFGAGPEAVEENYLKVNELGKANDGLASFLIGFHAEYTTSMERMEAVAGLAQKYKSPAFLHNSETRKEVDECIERWGKTPTQLMDSIGMYDFGGGGYHCVYFDEEDIRIFKDKKLWAVTNPCSNLKLASGIAPVKRYLEEGINLAIGTDGSASNNALDFFREMYLAATLSKAVSGDAAAVDASKILYAATAGGAQCMSLDDCDRLEVGKKADIVMIDMHQPNMQPENNIIMNLVYSGSKSNVKLTMVNGKILYEDGKYDIGFDPEEIYAKANAVISRMR